LQSARLVAAVDELEPLDDVKAKGSSIAKAAVGATIMIICMVALWKDIHLSSHDVVYYGKGPKSPYMNRWLAEAIYVVCAILGGTLLAAAIRESTKE